MTLTLITVIVGLPCDGDRVEVADSALPHLERWFREHGYIHVSEANVAGVIHQLAEHAAPIQLHDTGDCE